MQINWLSAVISMRTNSLILLFLIYRIDEENVGPVRATMAHI